MILMVAYGGGHVAMLAPVAAALSGAGEQVVFLALTTARAYLERLGIASIGFRDLPGAEDPAVLAHGERLAAGLPPGGSVAHEETVAYLGLNYRDLVAEHGPEGAAEQYRLHGRQAFLPLPTMLDAIAALKPALVVATNAPRAERAAILAAGRSGVPSLCAVDLFAAHEIEWCGAPGYADRVCLLNEDVRQAFLAHGRRAQDLAVTGNPAFDRLQDAAVIADGARLRAARGWDDERITLLWASQVEPERHPFSGQRGDPTLPRRIEAYLRHFVAQNVQYRLVVRYHPSERVAFAEEPGVHLSPSAEDVSALLHAVDLVIVTASTVGLEAALAGRPVIAVDESIFRADAPYSSMGIARGAPRVDALGALIGELAPGLCEQRGRLLAAGAGTATARVVREIRSLLR